MSEARRTVEPTAPPQAPTEDVHQYFEGGAEEVSGGSAVLRASLPPRLDQTKSRSLRSWSSLHLMQSSVSGRASRRFTWISSLHSSQIPNSPSSIFLRAFSILCRRMRSRPRRRNVKDCMYSL